jgi:hypothetical protein
MKIGLITGLLAIALVSCASETKQPDKKWNVKVTTSSQEKVWMWKPDGSMQCEKDSAVLDPDKAMAELKKAGVLVSQARQGHDGMMHTAVCGSATGNTVEVEVSKLDVARAQALGYKISRTLNAPNAPAK